MVIKFRNYRANVKKLHNFELKIHTATKLENDLKEYNCKLLSNGITILKGLVLFPKIKNKEDLIAISALFLEEAFEPDKELESFCKRYGIETIRDLQKTVGQYFNNKASIENLQESQLASIENWVYSVLY